MTLVLSVWRWAVRPWEWHWAARPKLHKGSSSSTQLVRTILDFNPWSFCHNHSSSNSLLIIRLPSFFLPSLSASRLPSSRRYQNQGSHRGPPGGGGCLAKGCLENGAMSSRAKAPPSQHHHHHHQQHYHHLRHHLLTRIRPPAPSYHPKQQKQWGGKGKRPDRRLAWMLTYPAWRWSAIPSCLVLSCHLVRNRRFLPGGGQAPSFPALTLATVPKI